MIRCDRVTELISKQMVGRK